MLTYKVVIVNNKVVDTGIEYLMVNDPLIV